MPTYNSENYISESIKSVINQSYENWELLITDDFSTDKTIKVVQDFQKQDDRIILFQLKINKGAGIARNNSISNAKGRFIAFLDSDDRWKPNKLKTQIDFMLFNKLSLTYSGYDVINEKGSYIKTIIAPESINYSEILSNNYIGCLTAIYDTNSIGKKYMPDIRRRQDWVLWINILELIRETKGITDSLAIYVDRKDSISGNKFLMLKYNWTVYSNILGFNKVKSFLLMINFIIHYAFKKIK
jgi:glycosyltransferase involved in cell wall biosynthesis